MKKVKGLTAFFLGMMLWIVMSISAIAESDANVAVNDARNGVLQINLLYVDQNGFEHLIQGGSGFLIGETSGAEYVITNAHVVKMNDDTRREAGKNFGDDFLNNNHLDLQIQVVVMRDVTVNASVEKSSEEMDFAILKLEQPIYDRVPLTINSHLENTVATSQVYALGFPAVLELGQDATYYTSEDVNVMAGIISKMTTVDSINYIQHSATLSDGNSGGPLVNQNGEVIGLNRAGIADTYYYSIHMSEITKVLDALGIQYTASNSEVVTSAPEQDAVPDSASSVEPQTQTDKSALSGAIADAKNIQHFEADKYTEESIGVLQDAVREGDAVIDNSMATQSEIDTAFLNLQAARNGLQVQTGTAVTLITVVIVAVVIVILIVLMCVLLFSGKKNKKKETATFRESSTIPSFADRRISSEQSVTSAYGKTTTVMSNFDVRNSEGAGETSVLNQGAGETSVLGGGRTGISASLTRVRNGEHISISRQIFRIGKERAKVDYCIPDNNSISRHHANIVARGGMFYLVDLDSTNATFLNGNRIAADQEVKLNSGDRIKLADEEFEFRC